MKPRIIIIFWVGLITLLLAVVLLNVGADTDPTGSPDLDQSEGGIANLADGNGAESVLPTGDGAGGGGRTLSGPSEALENGAAAMEPFGWSGRVLDADGNPLGGVGVFNYDPWTFYDTDSPLTRVTTDAEGRFFIPWPRRYEWRSDDDMSLRCADPRWRSSRVVMPAPAAPPTAVDLPLLDAANLVHLTVLDILDRSPMEGLPIMLDGSAWSSHGVTDARGRLTLASGAGESCEMMLDPDTPGELEGPWPLQVPADEALELTVLYNGPPRAIRLRAVEENQVRAVAPAEFHAIDRYGRLADQVQQDADGTLLWEPEDLRSGLNLQVRAAGFLPTWVHLRSRSKVEPLPVPLARMQTRELQLRLLRGGVPVEEAEAEVAAPGALLELHDPEKGASYVSRSWSGGVTRAVGVSDAEGLVGVDLATRADGFPEVVQIVVRIPGEEDHDLGRFSTKQLGPMPWPIELEPNLAEVEFHVQDPEGRAVAEEWIALWYQPGPDSPLPLRARHLEYPRRHISFQERDAFGRTDDEGIYRVEVPAPCAFSWRNGRNSEVHAEETLVPGEVRRIEITSLGSLMLRGVVVTADGKPWSGPGMTLLLYQANGSPPPGFEDQAWYQWPRWAYTSVRYEEGGFLFREVPRGTWRIGSLSFPLDERIPTTFEAGNEDIVLRLQPLNRLGITAMDAETGLALSGEGDFHVFDPNGFWYWNSLWDGKGAVRFPAFGETWVQVIYEGYRPAVESVGEWNVPGEQRNVEIQLHRGRLVHVMPQPAAAAKGISRILIVGMDPDDPRQNLLRWGRADEILLNGVSFEALRLQPVDGEGAPVGPPIEVPAGTSELTLDWLLHRD